LLGRSLRRVDALLRLLAAAFDRIACLLALLRHLAQLG
jgi:hypothetical protein